MVNVTQVLVALVLFAVLLAVALTILAGVVPGFNTAIKSLFCGLGLQKCA